MGYSFACVWSSDDDPLDCSNVHYSIIGELTRSIPHDLPPLSETAVTYGLGRGASYASRAAFFDAYTAERKIGIGGDLGDPRYSIRASRVRIREWLATNLDVQWNKRFVRYEKTEKGVTAFFADGTSFTREMLVGCEGINSYGEPPYKCRINVR